MEYENNRGVSIVFEELSAYDEIFRIERSASEGRKLRRSRLVFNCFVSNYPLRSGDNVLFLLEKFKDSRMSEGSERKE